MSLLKKEIILSNNRRNVLGLFVLPPRESTQNHDQCGQLIYLCHYFAISFSRKNSIVSEQPPSFLPSTITCGKVDPCPNSP